MYIDNFDKASLTASTAASIPSPLEKLYDLEKNHADKVYMVQPTDTGVKNFTWGETIPLARKVAAHIKTYRFSKGTRIALLAKNSAEWIITDIAIAMAGHISVPIFATAGEDTINYVLEHAECPLMFVGKLDDAAAYEASTKSRDIITIGFPYSDVEASVSWQECIDIDPINDSPVPDMNNVMTIIYTSGSTGQPKGVVHTFYSISWAAYKSLDTLCLNGEDRLMSYLPLAHITERVLVEATSFYNGMQLNFVEKLETFNRDVKAARPTVFISVPRLWTKFQLGVLAKLSSRKLNLLLKIPFLGKKVAHKIRSEMGLDQTRLFASGSAPLAPATIEWFAKIGMEICEGWGMTENCAYGSASVPYRADKIGSIGRAYPEVDIRLASDGEIQVKAACNMIGYYKDQEKTTGAFTNDGYLRTGDKGRIDEDGYIFITGRLKDIFKTEKGKYVTPAPIEAKIMENSYVDQVCVTGSGLPQPIGLLVLSEEALVESKEEVAESLEQTLESVNAHLESHQRLDRLIVFSDEWSIENDLLTPTLKVKRHKIEEQFGDVISAKYKDKIVWS